MTILDKFVINSEKADQLRALFNMAGWQVVQELLQTKKAYYIEKLKREKELNKIYYAQAMIETIEWIEIELKSIIREGEDAQIVIEKYKKKGG